MTAITRERAAGIALLRRAGSGTPLILLHGIGSDAEGWAGVLAALPPGVDAWAWDAPGYGGSDPLPDGQSSPEDYAAALDRMMDSLGMGRAVVAGHSLGCLFAGRFAASRPGRVAALALLSPALGYGVPPDGPLPAGAQARLDEFARLGAAGLAESRAPRLLHGDRPAVLAGVRRAMAALRPDGYAAAVRALASGDLLGDATRIAAPTLVAIGTEDAITPPSNAHRVHAALPNARPLRLVPATGHALPQEEPALVAGMLGELVP